jgi:hypothetical protein
MQESVRLLAVSRMEKGFCVAGVAEGRTRWVRPIRPKNPIDSHDLLDASGRHVRSLDLVSFELVRPRPQTPHVEDWHTNFNRRPVIEQSPDDEQRLAVLERLREDALDVVLAKKSRSLVLIEPDALTATFEPPANGRNYSARISFSSDGVVYSGESATPGFPVTDLQFRRWGRRFGRRTELVDDQLKQALKAERIFLTIGLTRIYDGKHWPMVVGVHAWPDYECAIDFADP